MLRGLPRVISACDPFSFPCVYLFSSRISLRSYRGGSAELRRKGLGETRGEQGYAGGYGSRQPHATSSVVLNVNARLFFLQKSSYHIRDAMRAPPWLHHACRQFTLNLATMRMRDRRSDRITMHADRRGEQSAPALASH